MDIDLHSLFKWFNEKIHFRSQWRHWWKQPHACRRLSAHYLTGGSVERRCILEKKSRLSADEIPDVPGGSSRAPGFLSPRFLRSASSFFFSFGGPEWIVSTGSLQVQAQGAAKFLPARANWSMIWLLIHLGGGRWGILGALRLPKILFESAEIKI